MPANSRIRLLNAAYSKTCRPGADGGADSRLLGATADRQISAGGQGGDSCQNNGAIPTIKGAATANSEFPATGGMGTRPGALVEIIYAQVRSEV